jgi:hypothetical protein
MEDVKTWQSSQAADFFDIGIQNLYHDTTSALVLAVTVMRSGLSMYIFFIYKTFFSHCFVC